MSLKCEKAKYISTGIFFCLVAVACALLVTYSVIMNYYRELFFFFIPMGCLCLVTAIWLFGTGCTLTEDDVVELEEID